MAFRPGHLLHVRLPHGQLTASRARDVYFALRGVSESTDGASLCSRLRHGRRAPMRLRGVRIVMPHAAVSNRIDHVNPRPLPAR
jgi:hypothetical protein